MGEDDGQPSPAVKFTEAETLCFVPSSCVCGLADARFLRVLLETDPAAVVARVNLLDGPEPNRQEVQSLNQVGGID